MYQKLSLTLDLRKGTATLKTFRHVYVVKAAANVSFYFKKVGAEKNNV